MGRIREPINQVTVAYVFQLFFALCCIVPLNYLNLLFCIVTFYCIIGLFYVNLFTDLSSKKDEKMGIIEN